MRKQLKPMAAAAAILLAISLALWAASARSEKPAAPTGPSADAPAAADKDREIVASIGIKLVKIPPGEFMMGNGESLADLAKAFPLYEADRFKRAFNDEFPQHKVRITRPFYLGVCTVTVGQFKQFVADTGYVTEAERPSPPGFDINTVPEADRRKVGPGGYGYNADTHQMDTKRNPAHTWRTPGWEQADDHPVVEVTWNDAVAFCEWLSKKEGQHYRLPTEAEWEYACRAGTTTRYWSGDDPEELVKIANLYDASSAKVFPEWEKFRLKGDDGYAFTAPVGHFKPNPFGLYDMHGNVWQWVSDFHGDDYFAHSPTDDPQGPATGRLHVRRGGGWMSWPMYARSSFRNYNTPQSRYYNLGFRVARDP